MANEQPTVFQRLRNVMISMGAGSSEAKRQPVSYDIQIPQSEVLYAFDNKEARDQKLLQLKQQKLLSYQWRKNGYESSMAALAGSTQVRVMYRDVDLMDQWPEIHSGLDILSEEATTLKKGKMLNVYSKSERIKAVLEDLFVNRLDIMMMLPMITRDTCKYGNEFMFLNIDQNEGIIGWRRLDVYSMRRLENGIENAYGGPVPSANLYNLKPDEVKFIWEGHNEQVPYQSWQVAHFRLIKDSIFLPYGCITSDSRIETIDGYKEIKDIEIGDSVLTFNVETQEKEKSMVTMKQNKGVKPVYSLSTRHNEIKATSDHKFLCLSGENLDYKELKDIKIGDLIVVDNSSNKCNNVVRIDKKYPTSEECNLLKTMKWWNDYSKYIPDFVDKDFARFFGFMLGDGWITNKKLISFALGEYNTENNEFFNYLKKITGKTPKYVRPYNKFLKNEFSQVIVNSKSLATALYRMGFIDGFSKKRIPSWVYSCSDEIKKAFISGLMSADGSYNIDKYGILRCQIELANEELIKDFKTLIQSLGYKTSNVKSRNRIGKTSSPYNGRIKITSRCETFYFYYYESINKQEKKYDFSNRKKDGFKLEKVQSVNYCGEMETYDITVNNDNSNFFANGIVTHNCSYLNGARRHWRMLSMLEDAIFLHRLERSVERRIFKVNVGNIDEADVPAYLQEFANNFKRAPIVDPQTGQIDLRKNYLDVSTDYFIPVRPGQDPSSIDTLQGANFQNGMEDIEYFEKKILSMLKIPKTYLNFNEAQGKGQNLSLMDVRFSRTINSIQQTIIMELTKIAIIHLYLLGFVDDLTNFTLSLNNPSNQIELMELDNMTKRVSLASTALAEQGGGIPLMSWHDVQKEILGKTDAEIADILNQIRLESAIANELQLTSQIIKNTGLFKQVDRIYGEPGAKYNFNAMEGDGIGGGPMGGGGGGMPPMDGGFGDDMGDLGGPDDEGGDISGDEGSEDLGDMGGGAPLQEVKMSRGLIRGNKYTNEDVFKAYEMQVLTNKEPHYERPQIIDKGLMINEELMSKLNELEKISKDDTNGNILPD